jgi:hopanoid biosynthesis associated protein HpnK
MTSRAAGERVLITTADDFGMSVEVNEAIEQAHREGVLTSASLVVAGAAADDAVRRARRMPGLGVGLHLALFGAPAMADGLGWPLSPDGVTLGQAPVRTGIAIMLSPRARAEAAREITAQVEAYRRTGLPMTHLDSHWHCHQHPAVLALALRAVAPLRPAGLRVPSEGWRLSRTAARAGLAPGRLVQALAHRPLAVRMRRAAEQAGIVSNGWFFGKVDAGRIDLPLLLGLVAALPVGVTELGLHPALAGWAGSGPHAPPAHWRQVEELAALTAPELREALARAGVRLARWDELGR